MCLKHLFRRPSGPCQHQEQADRRGYGSELHWGKTSVASNLKPEIGPRLRVRDSAPHFTPNFWPLANSSEAKSPPTAVLQLYKMTSVPFPNQSPPDRCSKLHQTALDGSTESLVALLSDGSIDIDQGNQHGWTPLMLASGKGHSHVVRILLNKRANASIVAGGGITALHASAGEGHLAVCKMLVNAGANVEAATTEGVTPLHMAAEYGHCEVMSMLIEAGANPNRRKIDGATPLFFAVQNGYMGAVILLLRAKANPLLTWRDPESGKTIFPLDMAAQHGHSEVVRELVQQVGIKGCGGASGGVEALRLAAIKQHLDIMITLIDAGVVDNGRALIHAAAYGRELSVKSLLQQRKDGVAAYVNYRDTLGRTTLVGAMGFSGFSPTPRIVRLVVDAGADTTSALRLTNTEGGVVFNGKPLALVSGLLRQKKIPGKLSTEEQLHRLQGIRRLLLRVEAVHAASFLWPLDAAPIVDTARSTRKAVATSTPQRMMMPIFRRTARRPRVLLAALLRWVV